MTENPKIAFAYPGDIEAPTGGYGYDRRVIAEARALGYEVRQISLPASFPLPSEADIEESRRLLEGDPGEALIVDGLAFGALPESLLRAIGRRPVALVHHPLFLETGLPSEVAKRLMTSERAALRSAAAVVATSRMTADIVARAFSVPRERLFVAEPGVEVAPRAPGSTDGVVRLLAVGSVIPRKGYEDLMAALARLAGDWRVRIIGTLDLAPDHAKVLRSLAGGLATSHRISFDGARSRDEVRDAYQQSDVFVTTSRFEGYGMALADAVACGLPIVATKEAAAAGACPSEAALTYNAGDFEALRIALERLVNDQGVRRRLADASWAAAAAQPRWPDTARAVLRAIEFARQGAPA